MAENHKAGNLTVLRTDQTKTKKKSSKTKFSFKSFSDAEILSDVGSAELPVLWGDIPGGRSSSVAGTNAERERLANQDGVGLPVLPPVPAHRNPTRLRPFDADLHDVPRARDVGDQNQIEEPEPVDGESDPALLSTRHPAIFHKIKKKKNCVNCFNDS